MSTLTLFSKYSALFCTCLFLGSQLQGQDTAPCSPATAQRVLDYNNVSALIEQGGTMWQNRAAGRAAYEVPKNSGETVLYAGAIWVGGVSPDNQLKIAAPTFRAEGNNFWPGPLSNGTAEVSGQTCQAYDEIYNSYRADAVVHRSFFLCKNDPSCHTTEQFPDGYSYPSYFDTWPAHGDTDLGQDYYLAPFYDFDEDGHYDPSKGDYPLYDVNGEVTCKGQMPTDPNYLRGDANFFWIFNDKGNIHTESGGEPIGLEVHAQAFAFATNDGINNMTFYNYQLINRGTQELRKTHFGLWADADLGNANNDYVGCDVSRGMGFSYNDSFDSNFGFPDKNQAIGIDFFEGPFQDADGVDNPNTGNLLSGQAQAAFEQNGIPYPGLGQGYGDTVIDNERHGMSKFVYYNIGNGVNGDPSLPHEYYNYLRGRWKNGQSITVGGNGYNNSAIPTCYMFPGESDPYGYGTGGNAIEPWTEQTADNPSGDRRFLMSAGPFTLEPGARNNVTAGVVWAEDDSNDELLVLEKLRILDDQAQALFNVCFKELRGVDAPDLAIQELENELVLMLSNGTLSNNQNEDYIELDPSIPEIFEGEILTEEERSYRFQGYQIFQVKDAFVSTSELDDVNKARLIFQVDREDDVDQIVNFIYDPAMGVSTPTEMVNGENSGIQHSLSVTEDQFALGDKRLVNFKTYHFIAIAYAHNSYGDFDPQANTGQALPYIRSERAARGAIEPVAGIPHCPSPEAYGTYTPYSYGDELPLTQWEGMGNGQKEVRFARGEEERILAGDGSQLTPLSYAAGYGPVSVKVIDPLKVTPSEYALRLVPTASNLNDGGTWILENLSTGISYAADQSIDVLNEQLFPELGLSVTLLQSGQESNFIAPISAQKNYADQAKPWLEGIADQDGLTALNWIRAGNFADELGEENVTVFDDYLSSGNRDLDQRYEGLVAGTWAPYQLCSYSAELDHDNNPDTSDEWVLNFAPTVDGLEENLSINHRLDDLNNVDIVFTADRSLWTRCAVLEMQADPAFVQSAYDADLSYDSPKMHLRNHPSVDKLGRTVVMGGNAAESTLNGAQPYGMSWFPGYAIDLNTGDRLNLAFGEDSFLGSENGWDMIWNPSSRARTLTGEILGGGQHWIYMFRNAQWYEDKLTNGGSLSRIGNYDQGQALFDLLSAGDLQEVYRCCTWVGSTLANADVPMLAIEDGLIPTKTRISLRVKMPYQAKSNLDPDVDERLEESQNNWWPYYTFSTQQRFTALQQTAVLEEALEKINVVPNPYYGHSSYAENKWGNKVKITNLPEECSVHIYTVNGNLVRSFTKNNRNTYLDWNLLNDRDVPIAPGTYIIHVEVPEVGERVLKWFGSPQAVDLVGR